jgi:two-component system sensor histidine kinase QseC
LKTKQASPVGIKKRLIITTVCVSSFLVLLSWSMIFYQTQHEINEVYDARLGQSAKIIALSMPNLLHGQPEAKIKVYENWYDSIALNATEEDEATRFGHPYEQNFIFQLFSLNKVMIKSPDAPNVLIGDTSQSGFSFVTIDNEGWRRFQIELPPQPGMTDKIFLVAAENSAIRQELINEIAMSTGLPQLLLIPCLALTIIILVNKFLQPISELRQAIAQRNINKLDRIIVTTPTKELTPLVGQLNFLFAELDKAWQRERRLTRTAAHELKTPLTVLRLNAENALNSQNKDELDNDLRNILLGIDRTDRLIQQLLMISKIESQQHHMTEKVNLTHCLREVLAAVAPLALKQQQTLALDGNDTVCIQGDSTILAILFSNIIDNAIRYSGVNASIGVCVMDPAADKAEVKAEVRISDNGPAIADDIRDKMFEKFYRGHSERGDGAGLGMSIAADIAKLYNGHVRLLPAQSGRGNVFSIVFLNT